MNVHSNRAHYLSISMSLFPVITQVWNPTLYASIRGAAENSAFRPVETPQTFCKHRFHLLCFRSTARNIASQLLPHCSQRLERGGRPRHGSFARREDFAAQATTGCAVIGFHSAGPSSFEALPLFHPQRRTTSAVGAIRRRFSLFTPPERRLPQHLNESSGAERLCESLAPELPPHLGRTRRIQPAPPLTAGAPLQASNSSPRRPLHKSNPWRTR